MKSSGKGNSPEYPGGLRRIERATGRKFAPKSLRERHRYLHECTDVELAKLKIRREEQYEVRQ